eukprot:328377-Prymnesium_polylepis.1
MAVVHPRAPSVALPVISRPSVSTRCSTRIVAPRCSHSASSAFRMELRCACTHVAHDARCMCKHGPKFASSLTSPVCPVDQNAYAVYD